MRVVGLAVVVLLAGCGGSDGGTTGTNYSDPPPVAEIVATPSPDPTPTPTVTPTPEPSPTPAATDEKMTMVDPGSRTKAKVAE